MKPWLGKDHQKKKFIYIFFFKQVYVNDHPQYVKIISPQGTVEHKPWASVYIRMRESAGIQPPGYIVHESACWSDVHEKWFFLPRRASKET